MLTGLEYDRNTRTVNETEIYSHIGLTFASKIGGSIRVRDTKSK